MKKYTKRQICEAIAHWKSELRMMNESEGQTLTCGEMLVQMQAGLNSQQDQQRMLNSRAKVGLVTQSYVGDIVGVENAHGEVLVVIEKPARRGQPVPGSITTQELVDKLLQQDESAPVFVMKYQTDPVSIGMGLKDEKMPIERVDYGGYTGCWVRVK